MGCQPCEERKQRLEALAAQGEALPKKDYAFYAGWAIAVAAVGYLAWTRLRERT